MQLFASKPSMKPIQVSRRFDKMTPANHSHNRRQEAKVLPSEFLSELQSAASMIMSREECQELERELLMLRQSGPRAVAA
jgi:hypothetical protein